VLCWCVTGLRIPHAKRVRPPDQYFYHREFSFTIDETYIRYQSFRNTSELRTRLKAMKPHKIDIGAVYTLPVRR